MAIARNPFSRPCACCSVYHTHERSGQHAVCCAHMHFADAELGPPVKTPGPTVSLPPDPSQATVCADKSPGLSPRCTILHSVRLYRCKQHLCQYTWKHNSEVSDGKHGQPLCVTHDHVHWTLLPPPPPLTPPPMMQARREVSELVSSMVEAGGGLPLPEDRLLTIMEAAQVSVPLLAAVLLA